MRCGVVVVRLAGHVDLAPVSTLMPLQELFDILVGLGQRMAREIRHDDGSERQRLHRRASIHAAFGVHRKESAGGRVRRRDSTSASAFYVSSYTGYRLAQLWRCSCVRQVGV